VPSGKPAAVIAALTFSLRMLLIFILFNSYSI
jgi:hypothetical protein